MSRFVDPAVNFGVSFEKAGTSEETEVVAPAPEAAETEASDSDAQTGTDAETVVSLDAFRRK